MKNNRIISRFLATVMFLTVLPSYLTVGAEHIEKSQRQVYLHAQDRNPTGVAPSSTVIKDDPFNLYFSIDNPNKGSYNDAENDADVETFVNIAVEQKRAEVLPDAEKRADDAGISDPAEREKFIEDYLAPILSLEAARAEQVVRHTEKQYDLNGYTIRIYYDKNYFKLQDGVNPAAPIDYTIPDKTISDSETDEDERDPENNSSGNISYNPGYSAYWEYAGFDSRKGLDYAELTLFLYGSFLPQEKNDPEGNKWYDLCALPLVPIRTGSTKVSVEIGGDSSKCSLVLFSKHEDIPGFEKEFGFSAINGGVHTINIVNSVRPEPPVATPLPEDFLTGDKVKLKCGDLGCTEENEKHDIYYSIDGVLPYKKYEGEEITIDKTTVISCYSVKKSDSENKSETVSFKYEILPDKPILFVDTAGKPITNVYNSTEAFSVYCDTELIYDNDIGADANIYYTFSDMSVEENIDSNGRFKTDGTSPETEWVKAEKSLGLRIDIDKTVNVKLVTVRENASSGQEISGMSSYFLGIRPGKVTANPPSGENPGRVELFAEEGCEIYYTLDGSDPVVNGTRYNGEIPITKDTQIRAVAKKDGVYSLISDFSYTVTNKMGSVISSNYPSGEYEGKISVSLSSDKPEDKILYSTDGSEPSIPYDGSIDVSKSTVIKAKVQGSDDIFEFDYKIKPLAPIFAPGSTHFSQADEVTVYCAETINDGLGGTNEDEYTLFYTLDGSDPTTNPDAFNTYNSPVNTAVIPVNGHVVIKAAVRTKDGVWSDVNENTYDVLSYKLAPPVPTLKPGQYEADKMTTKFFAEQDGCEIYYTVSYGEVFEKDPVANDKTPNVHYVPGSDIELTGRMIIKAFAVNKTLGLKSDVAVYEYIVNPKETPGSLCYPDKESGIYEMLPVGEEFVINLHAKNPSDVIKYKVNDGEWKTYDSATPVKIEDNSVLYVAVNDGEVASYSYEFIPKPPVSTLLSGRYILKEPPYQVRIELPEGYSADDYYLFFRDNEAPVDSLANGGSTYDFDIDASVSYKAYVVHKKTNKKSENAVFYYIVESEEVIGGEIYTLAPYDVKSGDTKYIGTHLLSEKGFNEGIKLETKSTGTKIKYKYTYTKKDGTGGGTDYQFFSKSNPIMVTSSMTGITVEAYLTDSAGNEIPGTDVVFNYVFEDIGIPQFSLTDFNIKNDYPGDSDYIIYYTLDGSDPDKSDSRIKYDGEKIDLKSNTTIKTVYYKACDDPSCPCASGDTILCENHVYGGIGTFYYEAPKYIYSGGGGGGGGSYTVDARRYTKDIFGNEHVSHINYIKGYPDGSVKPEGNITREEVTAILYRVRDKKYDKPFSSTGDVFPDVKADRWSVTEIEFMASEEVVKGYPDSEFKPSRNLTRAEFAALIYRFCKPDEADIDNKFTDVSKEHWAYDEILSLLKSGLIQGYEDNTFRPEKNITRAEVITVMNKILGRKPVPSYVKSLNFNPFNDLEMEKWYYTDVLEATITHDYYLNQTGYEYKWENWK